MPMQRTISLPINNGAGSWQGAYPTMWATITGKLTISAPQNADTWHVKATDGAALIFEGNVRAATAVNVNYKTGAGVQAAVAINNVSQPAFSGTLTVDIEIDL